ncbi:MAG: DUF4743 domain-containing protein [Rhodospirillaceae bacterium]|nr:DUF4743 domain-containing protein [Rhodospirillaceae bacterium]
MSSAAFASAGCCRTSPNGSPASIGSSRSRETRVKLHDSLGDFETRSQAVEGVLRHLRAEGDFGAWRDEPYPVATGFSSPPLLRMERAAVPRL